MTTFKHTLSTGFLFLSFLLLSLNVTAQGPERPTTISHTDFLELLSSADPIAVELMLLRIEEEWSPEYRTMVIESLGFAGSRTVNRRLNEILHKKAPAQFGTHNDWYQWMWNQPEAISDDYAEFKAGLYRQIDPRFEAYFQDRQDTAKIRLDEIRWGGVSQDGIPPLRNPEMISASEASYLEDDNIVFGVEINGQARAYPKRILAWHEMFTDVFGEGDSAEPIAGVYCTLCGTVVIYKTRHKGVEHALGTSGFLYRSNKLMYDKATSSLWNTVRGEPVVGPLSDKGIALEHLSVVTTTWKEWVRRHPNTEVLSLETGHRRDYGEGVAYQDYFSSDRLMFNTPFNDERLKNKQEVLALRFPGAPNKQLAIDSAYLDENPVFHEQVAQQKFVVLTDHTGANRVYDPGQLTFKSYDREDSAVDENGKTWRITEQALIGDDGTQLARLPYHRAFWFGWHAAYPDTRLIK